MPVDNRAALIKGARQCIEQLGYARTTARDIATAAGVSLGAIGYHFGSKEELLNEAIGQGFEEWLASFATLIASAGDADAETLLRAAVPRFFDLMATSEPLLRAFVEAFAFSLHHPELRAQLAEQYRQNRQMAVEMLRSDVGRTIAGVGFDLETLSSLMIALVDGLVLQYLLDPSHTPGAGELLALLDVLP